MQRSLYPGLFPQGELKGMTQECFGGGGGCSRQAIAAHAQARESGGVAATRSHLHTRLFYVGTLCRAASSSSSCLVRGTSSLTSADALSWLHPLWQAHSCLRHLEGPNRYSAQRNHSDSLNPDWSFNQERLILGIISFTNINNMVHMFQKYQNNTNN